MRIFSFPLVDTAMKTLRLVVLGLVLSVFAVQTFAGTIQDEEFNDEKELSDSPSRRFSIPKIGETIRAKIRSRTINTIKNRFKAIGSRIKNFFLARIKKLLNFLGIKASLSTTNSPAKARRRNNFYPNP